MAENTERYKVVIDTEVEGQDNVELLNRTIKTSIGEFENLNEAIGKTQDTLGKVDPNTKEFKQLSKELQVLKDRLQQTEISSLKFTDALAAQPGIVGTLGSSIKGLDGGLKVLAANPIIAAVTLLSSLFITLRQSLTKTSEGQETLNRISAAFGKILGPVFAVIEKVALPIFEKFADLLELVSEGFNKFARFLGVSQEKINEAARASSEVLQSEFEEQQKYLEDIAKQEEDARKKLEEDKKKKSEEARKKREEEDRKNVEAQKKLLDEANKILVEQYIKSLEDRDAEVFKREQLFNAEKAKLIEAGFTDFTLLEENYRNDIASINQKFDDEELKKEEELQKQIQELRKAEFDEQLLALDNQLSELGNSFDRERQLISEKEALLLSQEGLTQQQRVAIARAAAAERTAIDMAELESKADLQNKYLDLAGQFGSVLQQISGRNKKLAIAGIVIEKAAAIGKIIANTSLANAKAVAALPLTGGLPFTAINTVSAGLGIAATIAGAAKSIQQINSAESGGGGGSATLPSVGGSSGVSAPQVGGITAPQITGTEGGNNPTAQIASTLAARSEQNVRAYVVERDISSSQALSRRTSKAASFG
jgi:hypothetical protein